MVKEERALGANGKTAKPSEREYWVDPDERQAVRDGGGGQDRSGLSEEWKEILSAPINRRTFLKFSGLSALSSAILSACWKVPVREAVPYFSHSEDIIPGHPVFYSTAYWDGYEFGAVLVKTREGRPIKIEPHPRSLFGATSPRIQASLLSLYDSARRFPLTIHGKQATVDELHRFWQEKVLQGRSGDPLWIVTSAGWGPATRKIFQLLRQQFADVRILYYEPDTKSALLDVHEEVWGKRVLPDVHLEKARVVVAVDSDFLVAGPYPAVVARRYGQARRVHRDAPAQMRHYQFETWHSVTGSNADVRRGIHPGLRTAVLVALYNEVARLAGNAPLLPEVSLPESVYRVVQRAARDLWAMRPESVVLSDVNDPDVQRIVMAINLLVGAYESGILDVKRGSLLRQGSDHQFFEAMGEWMRDPRGTVIFWDVDPVYHYFYGDVLAEALQKNENLISIALASRGTATVQACQVQVPVTQWFESWWDYEPVEGYLYLAQPVVQPLHGGIPPQEVFLQWAGASASWKDFLKQSWAEEVYPRVAFRFRDPEVFWESSVHDTEVVVAQGNTGELTPRQGVADLIQRVQISKVVEEDKPVLRLAIDPILGDGRHANNAWLQELPHPLLRTTWGNYLVVNSREARSLGWKEGQVVRVSVARALGGTYTVEVPVVPLPGQPHNVYTLHLGHGNTVLGPVARKDDRRVEAFRTYRERNGRQYLDDIRLIDGSEVVLEETGRRVRIPSVQKHHRLEGRPIVKETTLAAYEVDRRAGNHDREHVKELRDITLYPERVFPMHHWEMVIDLTLCIGCGACIAACNNENNVPVVGPEEVVRHHEMHWLRIDRYFTGDEDEPQTVYQPMLCQQCDHAPCENVCPVAATNSSPEGINQMAYNRCIGTRYCANNCPYKVRRFNWYDYTGADSLPGNERQVEGGPFDDPYQKMALNPDVVVRARGVMEKCTFCIQRIQYAKLQAKGEGRPLRDGDVVTACQSACPTGAIYFGDGKDPNAQVTRIREEDERLYYVLEELHVLPSVGYLVKIRNIPEDLLPASSEVGGEEQHAHHG